MLDRALVDDIKRRLPPRLLARLLGLLEGSKLQGRDGILVRCPAHGDDTASCSLTLPDDATRVKCFGCDLAGDALHLIAAVERLDIRDDFADVAKRAAELAGVPLDGPPLPPLPPRPAAPPQDPPLGDDRFAAVVAPILYCGQLVPENTGAADVVAYLAGRGLLEAARADGWAALPPTANQEQWSRALWDAAEQAPGYALPFTRPELVRAGLFRGDGFAHPENRLAIPYRDREGRVVGLQRRRLDGQKACKYVFAAGRPVLPYGLDRLDQVPAAAPIVWVEGAADVLALRLILEARGEVALVLGLPGVAAWRESWAPYARGRVAAVAVDTDAAGESAVMKIARDLASAGARRLERWAPPGKDWASDMGAAS